MRTIIICFLLSSGILGLAFSCCPDDDNYWNITNIQASFSNYPPTATQINEDTLVIELALQAEFLATQQSTFINPFINNSYATSCQEPGHLGMKDELIHIEVTSSNDFNNYPAGISLTPIINCNNFSVEDWVSEKQYNSYYFVKDRWFFYITEKPTASSNLHDFKITLTFVSGRTEEVQMGAITWN